MNLPKIDRKLENTSCDIYIIYIKKTSISLKGTKLVKTFRKKVE